MPLDQAYFGARLVRDGHQRERRSDSSPASQPPLGGGICKFLDGCFGHDFWVESGSRKLSNNVSHGVS
jgi:hypothetical protein